MIEQPVNTRKALLIALSMGVLYVVVLAYPVHRHVVGAFSDFYVRFAPDADRVAAGEFPRNTYNPPGYPTLLVLASPLTGDHFTTGKWMSLLAGGLTGALAFVLFRRLFGPGPALLAVPIILTSAVFATYAITAMTDVPFVLLCLVVMIAITSEGPHRLRTVILSGVLCGIAYLIRYNAVFLLVPGLAAALWGERRWSSRATLGAAYLASFLVTVAPWLWMNYTHHGSPFYSTNYEDVARAFGITRSTPFTSFADVLLHDPARFARRYASNLGYTFFQTLGAGLALLPVGPLAAIGIGAEPRAQPPEARVPRPPGRAVVSPGHVADPLGEALFLLHPGLLQRVRGVRRLRDRPLGRARSRLDDGGARDDGGTGAVDRRPLDRHRLASGGQDAVASTRRALARGRGREARGDRRGRR